VVLGAHTDLDALRTAATGANALTFDHEHVPMEMLDTLVADGVNVAPAAEALVHAQNKLVIASQAGGAGGSDTALHHPCEPSTTWMRSPRALAVPS
jgi:5-(carboxyamino)imidazole ribonucleotide synthase